MKFRKKPIVIDAVQWTGDNIIEIEQFIGQVLEHRAKEHALIIPTLEDGPDAQVIHYADVNDWIIKGVKGEFYPCKSDIFEATYERVS